MHRHLHHHRRRRVVADSLSRLAALPARSADSTRCRILRGPSSGGVDVRVARARIRHGVENRDRLGALVGRASWRHRGDNRLSDRRWALRSSASQAVTKSQGDARRAIARRRLWRGRRGGRDRQHQYRRGAGRRRRARGRGRRRIAPHRLHARRAWRAR